MSKTNKLSRVYTLGEEIFNSITHGVGGLIAIAALVLLIVTENYCIGNAIIAFYKF